MAPCQQNPHLKGFGTVYKCIPCTSTNRAQLCTCSCKLVKASLHIHVYVAKCIPNLQIPACSLNLCMPGFMLCCILLPFRSIVHVHVHVLYVYTYNIIYMYACVKYCMKKYGAIHIKCSYVTTSIYAPRILWIYAIYRMRYAI